MWLKVLHFMSIAAVLTNCALIAFASNQVWGPSPLNSFFLLSVSAVYSGLRSILSVILLFFWCCPPQIDLWIPGVSPSTKILLIFAFEHVVLGAKYLVHISTKAPKDKDADAALEREASSE